MNLSQQLADGGHDILQLHWDAGIGDRLHVLGDPLQCGQNFGMWSSTESGKELAGVTSHGRCETAQPIRANIATAHSNPAHVQRRCWQVSNVAGNHVRGDFRKSSLNAGVYDLAAKALEQRVEHLVGSFAYLIDNKGCRFDLDIDIL